MVDGLSVSIYTHWVFPPKIKTTLATKCDGSLQILFHRSHLEKKVVHGWVGGAVVDQASGGGVQVRD
jgi:hypothetical protein